MHTHLRAWRRHRKLSQEQVANALKKRASTISRWERGEMNLTTADLERLAVLYGASISQLSAPPAAAEIVAVLGSLQNIASEMDPQMLQHWMAIGRKLIGS